MKGILRFFASIFYWTYPRGSWQWDIYCLAIIAIIFLTPADFLEECTRNPMTPDQIRAALAKLFSL